MSYAAATNVETKLALGEFTAECGAMAIVVCKFLAGGFRALEAVTGWKVRDELGQLWVQDGEPVEFAQEGFFLNTR